MNRATLKAACTALWGPHYRSELARNLKVHLRTAMRWDRGESAIPQETWHALVRLLKKRKTQIDSVLASIIKTGD